MDLNEKLAARRKELNVKVQDKAKFKNSKNAKAVQDSHSLKPIAKQLSPEMEEKRWIAAEASARIKPKERQSAAIFAFLGIAGFFFAWWVGVLFLFLAFYSYGSTTNKHTKQIIEEESERKWRERIGLKD